MQEYPACRLHPNFKEVQRVLPKDLSAHLSRRDVLKTILVTTATSFLGGKVWASKAVSELSATVDSSQSTARILLSAFSALSRDGGSVRLGSSSTSQTGPSGAFYPIIINRISATEYAAVESACTHEGCVVGAFSGAVTTGRMTCPCHGSQYDIRGNVTQGPAAFPLLSYNTQVANGVLMIELPDYNFSCTQTTVLNGTEQRLALSWDALANVQYEVRYRPNFATEPTRATFSNTLAGATTVTTKILIGGGRATVYVLPQDGIYQVAVKLAAV